MAQLKVYQEYNPFSQEQKKKRKRKKKKNKKRSNSYSVEQGAQAQKNQNQSNVLKLDIEQLFSMAKENEQKMGDQLQKSQNCGKQQKNYEEEESEDESEAKSDELNTQS